MVIAAVCAGGGAQAQSFSSYGQGSDQTIETRGSDDNYAAVLSFSANTTVNEIGVWSSVDNAQDVELLIFSSAIDGGGGQLLSTTVETFSQPQAAGFLLFNVPFTFQAGQIYDVGILGDSGTLTGEWGIGNYTEGNVTEISANANFEDYADPTTGNYSGVIPWIEFDPTAVPEPATLPLFGGGVLAMAAAMRRKRAA